MRAAVERSHLHALPPDVLDGLLAGAVRAKTPAGSVTHREGEPAPHLELVVAGVVRAFVAAPDGRTLTVRYCRPGALLRMSPPVARQAVARDTRVSAAFLRELSERVMSFIDEIPGSAFATVRQRVARHLLELAAQREPGRDGGAEIVVTVSQHELADAAGTVREVVVRVLRELRQEGVLRTERDRIVILDPARLVPRHEWNPGS